MEKKIVQSYSRVIFMIKGNAEVMIGLTEKATFKKIPSEVEKDNHTPQGKRFLVRRNSKDKGPEHPGGHMTKIGSKDERGVQIQRVI